MNFANCNGQTLFEIIEVYFPIEFKAPAAHKDVFGISKEQLSDGLCACFVCHEMQSPFVLPMLIKKLSDKQVAADATQLVDTLSTLQLYMFLCAFGVQLAQAHLGEVYDKLNSIVLYGSDADVAKAAF